MFARASLVVPIKTLPAAACDDEAEAMVCAVALVIAVVAMVCTVALAIAVVAMVFFIRCSKVLVLSGGALQGCSALSQRGRYKPKECLLV